MIATGASPTIQYTQWQHNKTQLRFGSLGVLKYQIKRDPAYIKLENTA